MNKRFQFEVPSPERCNELGIKHEGLQNRTVVWLMGVSCGISYASGTHFSVILARPNTLTVETDSSTVINNVKDHLESYGFTVREVPNSLIDK